jgi:hypothetical protein
MRMKKFIRSALTITIVISLLLILPVPFYDNNGFATAAGPTEISGLISENATWTSKNNPYHIIGNTTVNTGVSLTIEAGTVVKFANNTVLTLKGDFNIKGTKSNMVVITNKDPLFQYRYGFYDFYDRFIGSVLKNGSNFRIIVSECSDGFVNISYAKFENSAQYRSLEFHCSRSNIITDSIFINNKASMYGFEGIIERCKFIDCIFGLPTGWDTYVYDSFFNNNIYGARGGMHLFNCSLNNNIIAYHGHGSLHHCNVSFNHFGVIDNPRLIMNSIYSNIVGVNITRNGGNGQIMYNNIHSNLKFNFKYYGSCDLDVQNNWWGTANLTLIDEKVYDIYDDIFVGELLYNPLLSFPVNIYEQPIADAGPDQTGEVMDQIWFNASGSEFTAKNILRYKWDFGDGRRSETDREPIVSHSYKEAGIYTVTLQIYDHYRYDSDTDICIIKVNEIEETQESPPVDDNEVNSEVDENPQDEVPEQMIDNENPQDEVPEQINDNVNHTDEQEINTTNANSTDNSSSEELNEELLDDLNPTNGTITNNINAENQTDNASEQIVFENEIIPKPNEKDTVKKIKDTDGDGYSDAEEFYAGSNIYWALSTPEDIDADGVNNDDDEFPQDITRWKSEKENYIYSYVVILQFILIAILITLVIWLKLKTRRNVDQNK